MTEYEVGVRAFTHVTVEADSPEEAREKAREEAEPRGSPAQTWEIDNVTDATPLE